MKLIMAADHAGYKLKQKLVAELVKKGYEVMDLTPHFEDGDDYPKVAKSLVKQMAAPAPSLSARRGILICGSGVGVCIAANRFTGIRAAHSQDAKEIKQAREHNDINVLCLSGWKTKPADGLKLIEAFMKTKASTAARHKRRVKQLDQSK